MAPLTLSRHIHKCSDSVSGAAVQIQTHVSRFTSLSSFAGAKVSRLNNLILRSDPSKKYMYLSV